ncbi:transposase [Streptomyces sp. WM6372]|uniref:transposase n=1 Tax=Streptomyces sp. WM6372 TaxID=1415555 RepID=UPI00099D78A2
MPVVGADLSKRLVPDELWELAAPLLPSFAARPQGGGTAPCDERAVFTAVVYALTSGCAWRHLPPTFGTSPATAHRRFTVWTAAGRPVASAAPGGRCWSNSGPGARWTGPRRSSTRPPFASEGGIADRAEPGRSRQAGQQAARAVRCPGHPARRRRVRREHARRPRPQTTHADHKGIAAVRGQRHVRRCATHYGRWAENGCVGLRVHEFPCSRSTRRPFDRLGSVVASAAEVLVGQSMPGDEDGWCRPSAEPADRFLRYIRS